jgi:Zn-dependent peptidase ImmA (M78 family)
VNLVFRPLEGLLGACLYGQGVLISTNRPLSVQRFTGAHELGHVVMNHETSIDGDEILGSLGPDKNFIELEANSFAAEFLLPRWLFTYHAKRQGWNADSIKDPACVYQLSLRSGASYEATIWALGKHGIIDQQNRDNLLKIQPKKIKQRLVPGYSPDHWFRDVWRLTRKDEGAILEGQPDDLFLIQLNERTGSGYLWDAETLKKKGFAILSDQRLQNSDDGIGADIVRSLAVCLGKGSKGNIDLTSGRPWQEKKDLEEHLKFQYDLFGKEVGLPRARRPELVVA